MLRITGAPFSSSTVTLRVTARSSAMVLRIARPPSITTFSILTISGATGLVTIRVLATRASFGSLQNSAKRSGSSPFARMASRTSCAVGPKWMRAPSGPFRATLSSH